MDDAHGLGVIGESGRGILEHFGLTSAEVPALVGTFGKAFGSFGAFVAGSTELVETLIQRARTYIYTTALPPAVAAATRAALSVSIAEPWRRERVLALTRRFRELAPGCRHHAGRVGDTDSAHTAGQRGISHASQQRTPRTRLLRRGDPPADGASGYFAPAHHSCLPRIAMKMSKAWSRRWLTTCPPNERYEAIS